MDLVAPKTIGRPFDVLQAAISAEFVLPWVYFEPCRIDDLLNSSQSQFKYRESWLTLFLGVQRDASTSGARFLFDCKKPCAGPQFVAFKRELLGKVDLERFLDIKSIFEQEMSVRCGGCTSSDCRCRCRASCQSWLDDIVRSIALIPNFSAFLP